MPAAGRRRNPMSVKKMDELPPGSQVIDDNMDISTKDSEGFWHSRETAPLTSAKLHKYGPIRMWSGVTV